MKPSLGSLQEIFSHNLISLMSYIEEELGYSIRGGEWWRPQEMANIYAKQGKGSRNSLHIDKLAIDLSLFKDDKEVSASDYMKAGDYWKTLDAMNRWGGDFINLHDIWHFSMSPDGIRS
jgi:hypothetical protein